ncbi:putative High choriolytic enzyme 1 [Hypsibius exemplaris]|uniref:Metalloendopeptidase n=1 Tax=Hypsibius exemplaris TaxID=2072580 RepID=A0A1W0WIQ9_HYPEX|nr:putative High choriolytic enzyme 1 [Hypsibius exemplaris]
MLLGIAFCVSVSFLGACSKSHAASIVNSAPQYSDKISSSLPHDWKDYIPFGAPNYSQPMSDDLFEGDIIIPDKAVVAKGVVINAMKGTNVKWPDAKIYYTIANNFSEGEKTIIQGAISHIEQRSCVRFQRRTNQHDHILIVDGGRSAGCSSSIGRIGGQQQLKLSRSSGCVHLGVIIHEFLHALGFYHEQSRSDRDDYLIINWENIRPSK